MKKVTVTIRGLNMNTPDSFVIDYINKHGSVVNNKVINENEKEGALRVLKNGNRKYLVDFTGDRNMGTYHLLDGAKITDIYPGQRKTCGRCLKTAKDCFGKAIARNCESKNRQRVMLSDHMKAHWETRVYSK